MSCSQNERTLGRGGGGSLFFSWFINDVDFGSNVSNIELV